MDIIQFIYEHWILTSWFLMLIAVIPKGIVYTNNLYDYGQKITNK